MPEQSIYMGEVGQVLWVEDKETCRAFMGEVWQVPWVENIERCVVHMGEVRKIDWLEDRETYTVRRPCAWFWMVTSVRSEAGK